MRLMLTAVTCLAVAGCARVAFYSDAELKGPETGIKLYSPKPYLLVARTGAKDKPTDISIIYIPDLSKPVYAKPKTGLGSSNLTLTLSNGTLASFGQQTDTKIPELIAALGGFATSAATARKTSREASLLRPEAAPDFVQISNNLATIASGLKMQLRVAEQSNVLTPLEIQVGGGIVATLRSASQLLSDPSKAEQNLPVVIVNLKTALDNWAKQIAAPSPATAGDELTIRRQLTTLQGQAQAILDRLAPKSPEEPTFSLYEIDNTSGATMLKEVKF